MPTCRAVIAQALTALSAIAPGDEASADELAAGLEALQSVILDLHDARGPLIDVDVSTPAYTPAENQRLRIQAGDTATVTLPNAVPIWPAPAPACDYGFTGTTTLPPTGTTASADGVQFRSPRDGTRIEIVGTTQGLYFYRADLNAWNAATGLALDDEAPLNARHASALSALVAERLIEALPGLYQPTPALARRIARGAMALMLRNGVARDPVMAEYF